MRIKALDGSRPHPSYGGWRKFLDTLQVSSTIDGVTHYYSSNCNYILFPCGTVVENFGFWGRALMSRIADRGQRVVLAELRAKRLCWQNEMNVIMERLAELKGGRHDKSRI